MRSLLLTFWHRYEQDLLEHVVQFLSWMIHEDGCSCNVGFSGLVAGGRKTYRELAMMRLQRACERLDRREGIGKGFGG